ncbi:hypothetical protein PHLGIDRAFT_314502 [Phlebiopsis gigantea 11061_1 CR5-6]|uniref:Uncharacterized protein n=1 Tax=Phlebiopsis gigantea (strain 11061_1 CR5-6) TaxID=745531 RepID=A0A0C3PAY4_PHLG1|nr:hypothetical protein PHLGIDRAFT_314502 [Phlebiopsis gigantea 11061_1 CR5-6]
MEIYNPFPDAIQDDVSSGIILKADFYRMLDAAIFVFIPGNGDFVVHFLEGHSGFEDYHIQVDPHGPQPVSLCPVRVHHSNCQPPPPKYCVAKVGLSPQLGWVCHAFERTLSSWSEECTSTLSIQTGAHAVLWSYVADEFWRRSLSWKSRHSMRNFHTSPKKSNTRHTTRRRGTHSTNISSGRATGKSIRRCPDARGTRGRSN